MATNGAPKRATAADIAAAVELGAIDPNATYATPDELAAVEANASAAAVTARPDGSHHECAIPGCRHGAAHGTPQPDRQLKLVAPCGAVARMTARALATAGGTLTCGHGDAFAVDATRRTYNRKP